MLKLTHQDRELSVVDEVQVLRLGGHVDLVHRVGRSEPAKLRIVSESGEVELAVRFWEPSAGAPLVVRIWCRRDVDADPGGGTRP